MILIKKQDSFGCNVTIISLVQMRLNRILLIINKI